ncbi:MAG: lipid-A-disaccharide synthase [Planctomycetota bacterium]|nr:MAG: lipid-A-disaccharide synthase [Planctomycetota bacterium]REJ95879.1 MAG: lipid-A-disaccharide synthase [Planctomycetota bacterium]REK25234.1 MAG: lipid-A-disaccharide synthase [Planctomycetota bacterium]REK34673.1 MAG: lipid-A-disaccharide synthase [Planctomycetota bacterium]
MHVFFSVGEPSGDQHGAALMDALRNRVPGARFSGFGGPKMEQAGLNSLCRLTDYAVMGVLAVIPLLWTFFKLVRQAGRFLEEHKPDAVVLIDFPGFNWWIARKAKRAGVPVFYYMPPQLWAWAPWRIRKVHRFIDHVLAALPFEAEWYRARGVSVECVGHPFFDEVAGHELDLEFCRRLRTGPSASLGVQHEDDPNAPGSESLRILGILPGSRNHEVCRNFPVMLKIIRRLHQRHPNVSFPVACYRDSHRELCREMLEKTGEKLPVELHVGRTSEIIETSDCCLMVSGSVSLELLARATPAVVLYRGALLMSILIKLLVTCRYMTLPNLIAGRVVMPEFPFMARANHYARLMENILERWITDDFELADAARALRELRDEVAQTGGVERAARAVILRTMSETPHTGRKEAAA